MILLLESNSFIFLVHREIKKFLENLRDRVAFVRNKRRQVLNAQDIDSCRVIIDVMHHLIEMLSLIEETLGEIHSENPNTARRSFGRGTVRPTFANYSDTYEFIQLQIETILRSISLNWQMPQQRLSDIQLELLRLRYMVRRKFVFVYKQQ